jgi:hypothetical protein
MLETEIKKLTAAIEANTAALTGNGTVTAAPATAPAPAATPAPAAEPAAAAPATEAPATPPEAPAAAVEVDKKKLTEKFIELAQAKGRDVATQLLAEFGVSKLPELKDKQQWPVFYAKCEELLA